MEKQTTNTMTTKTNNTINTTNHKISQFSDSRLTTAAVFAFLPSFGIFGVHNFILKQYGKGSIMKLGEHADVDGDHRNEQYRQSAGHMASHGNVVHELARSIQYDR